MIFAAIILGAIFGGLFPENAIHTKFLGEIFLNALNMMVVPLVVSSIIVGIANLGDLRKLRGMCKKTISYYLVTTGISVLIGLILVNIIRPGSGIQHGEDFPGASYRVDGNQILLEHTRLDHIKYKKGFQIILKDQNIAGDIDPIVDPKTNYFTVKHWESLQTGVKIKPQPMGTGIQISLTISEVVRGKDHSVFEVITDVFVGMIPTNIFKAMVETDVLPLIVFSILFGGMLTTLEEKAQTLIKVIKGINDTIMQIVQIIILFAPIGIFSLISARMGQSGGWSGFLPELVKLGWYSSTVIIGLLIHGLVILPLILTLVARRRVSLYGGNMLPALSTAFSTSSSSATLPQTLECVKEKNGVSNRTASFVVPLGATINMDGTALYEAVAALFIAQVYGIYLSPVEQTIVFLTATLAAIGAAGIPEAGLVTLVIVLRAVNLPIEGITLILIIDWFLDRCRTTVNVWGDSVGAAVIERFEKQNKLL